MYNLCVGKDFILVRKGVSTHLKFSKGEHPTRPSFLKLGGTYDSQNNLKITWPQLILLHYNEFIRFIRIAF